MAKYSKHMKACEIFFGIFVVVWILTRLIIYPFRVIYTALIEVYDYLDLFPSHVLFNGLLIILQILHIIWSYMIFRILLQKVREGQLKKDVRSDSESQESDDEEDDEDEKMEDKEKNGVRGQQTYSSRITTRSRSKQNAAL